MDRRNFLTGILAAAVAPSFIKTAGLLMPIKPLIQTVEFTCSHGVVFLEEQYGAFYTVTFDLTDCREFILKKAPIEPPGTSVNQIH